MSKILFTNGRIVNEGKIIASDLLVSRERIERIGPGPVAPAVEVIDLNGAYILPGLIDDQVHFREPGLTHKASIASESLAAICGGVTSYLDMPNNSPPIVDIQGLQAKKQIAADSSYANYGFYLGATNTNLEVIKRVTHADACAVKVFMGASTGNMLVDDRRTLEGIFAEAELPLATHCEDSPMIWAAEQRARERYGEDVPMSEHPHIRSAKACYKSSTLAVELAKRSGARLHVLHLTTGRELELFTAGPITDKKITAEVCVHHLWFEQSRYRDLGTLIKCNPAIKTADDRQALIDAVNNDVIDVIATDHAPHTLEEKTRGYFDAPSGLPLVQHMLPLLLEQYHDGVFSLERIVAKAAHNPATLFRIKERGFIREGYYADLAIVDLETSTVIDAEQIRYKCAWSPFDGMRFRSAIVMTMLNGHIVYRDGAVTGPSAGFELEFGA